MANAYRDENNVPTLIAVSSADGVTPVRLVADPITGRLLVSAIALNAVTQVNTGTGLTGGPITTTGTISLNSALAPMATLGTPGQSLVVNGAGTAVAWGNPTAATMTGASAGAPGTSGSVPAPSAGQQGAFLRGDATWASALTSLVAGNQISITSGNNIAVVGLSVVSGKTLTANNSITLAGTDGTTLTFQGTDTYVGRSTTDTLTNKTISGSSNTITNISLTSAVTGTLPFINGGTSATTQQGAINALTGTQSAGKYLRSDGTNATLSSLAAADMTGVLGVSVGGIGVGTLTGVAIGNGTGAFTSKTNPSGAFVGDTDTQTLTNKRIQPRTSSTTSTATLTPDLSSASVYYVTAQAAAITIANPTGTPVIGEIVIIYLTDNGTARAITFGANYQATGQSLPTTTTISKKMNIIAQYDGTNWITSYTNQP